MAKRPTRRHEFTIAIICALPLEADAVYYMFDETFHVEYHKSVKDPNHYRTGRIGKYNVVLVLLPAMGKGHSAGAAASLNASYTNLRLALLVGVCGGVPGRHQDGGEILLGDVVISNSLVQFDFGKRYPGGLFLRKASAPDSLGRLNKDLRSFLRSLETDRCRSDLEKRTAELLHELQTAQEEDPAGRRGRHAKYTYPGTAYDKLFQANYRHRHWGSAVTCCNEAETCEDALTEFCKDCNCDERYLISRDQLNFKRELEQTDPLKAQDPMIFIGPVASGDTVMKSGEDRDRITKEEKVIAFEMEGAGVWDEIPCIVIKGVCDYADSHKHKRWQNFSAATAAAAMKALLESLVDVEKPHDDARGRNLPFHLETITSKELFTQVLRSRFMDLGTKKIDRGEWFLEDQSNGKRLDLSKPWQSIIQPNQVLKMGMVFRRRNESSTQCPSCQFMNSGLSSDEIQCLVCGLAYRRVEELQNIQFNRDQNTVVAKPKVKSSLIEQFIKVFYGPSRPKEPATQYPEDEIGRYKYVQLVDVDFKFDQAGKDQQLVNKTLFLSSKDLRDSNHLAMELASVYGISEEDSLTVSKMVIDSFSTTSDTAEWIRVDKGLSDRLGLRNLRVRDQLATPKIPRSESTITQSESKVSALARHFENLSREFETERIRYRIDRKEEPI
ncbi:hypothetical protein FG05_30642 [Fusarium graminearum]|nr:hypothetical protein FG05_30642 [Fusarium graminearum]